MTWRDPVADEDESVSPATLTDSGVIFIYETLLGRSPAKDEVAQQMSATNDWRVLLEAVVRSPEFSAVHAAAAQGAAPNTVNIWSPDLGKYTHALGTWSPDGQAVVGREGWIYLAGGSNSVLSQYDPAFALPPLWGDEWTAAVEARVNDTRTLGASLALLVVPDKLSVLNTHLPESIVLQTGPPGPKLASELGLPVIYPHAALSQVPGGAYLRTDTHLSLAGNEALASTVMEVISDPAYPVLEVGNHVTNYVSGGDLGRRFEPAIVEIMSTYASLGLATILDDNFAAVRAAGRHLGSLRVLRNEAAADPRTVVVFGDSYSVPAAHYQGLAWYLAQHFAETHFVWSPFGWDRQYVERVGASVVVCEMAERFVPRPPDVRFDVATLAANALGIC